jgi:hypothetical protein
MQSNRKTNNEEKKINENRPRDEANGKRTLKLFCISNIFKNENLNRSNHTSID